MSEPIQIPDASQTEREGGRVEGFSSYTSSVEGYGFNFFWEYWNRGRQRRKKRQPTDPIERHVGFEVVDAVGSAWWRLMRVRQKGGGVSLICWNTSPFHADPPIPPR